MEPSTGSFRRRLLLGPQRFVGVAALIFGIILLAIVGLAAFGGSPADALPAWVHGGAQCGDCHHTAPATYTRCSACHPTNAVPNGACIKCHPGKTTANDASCWSCHAPGAPQPPATNAGCQSCHGQVPHLGAMLGSSPGCTICHSTNPTPHHDSVVLAKPNTCTDCHRHKGMKSHDNRACTDCHAANVHPSIPEVPASCNRCHKAATFNGRGDCRACHLGTSAFAGKTDNDIHDNTLPDPPISASSCTSCHPDKQKHAGTVGCTSCHTQADAFHHGTASSPGFKACADCHGNKPQHGAGLPCLQCHPNAMHLASPPIPTSKVCSFCHTAKQVGTKDCFGCHRKPIYHRTPSVPACTSCHPGFQQHAGRVACRTCHANPAGFHHGVTKATFRACTSCHGQKKQHGQGLSCTRCHGNAMHLASPPIPTSASCRICHVPAKFGTRDCFRCHTKPIYHVTPSVPGCTACHRGFQKHAGKVDCRQCHTNIPSGHHIGQVGIPSCQKSGCHTQQRHAGQVACTRCHPNAPHDVTPLNLPAQPYQVCLSCHKLATKAGACKECHDAAQHKTDPSPGPCTKCHENKEKHAGKVLCAECHTNVGPGHHKSGRVGYLTCPSCHLGVQVHASKKPGGETFTCAICHPGNIHGTLPLPDRTRCLECHAPARMHAADLACLQCHAPATHKADPSAKDFGSKVSIKTVLPRTAAQRNLPGGVPITTPYTTTTQTPSGETTSTTSTMPPTNGGATTTATLPRTDGNDHTGGSGVNRMVLVGVGVAAAALVAALGIALILRARRT